MNRDTTTLAVIENDQVEEQMQIIRISLGLKKEVPDSVVRATVLLSLQYGLSAANKEIQVIPTGNEKGSDGKWHKVYAPYVGVYGLIRSARRTSHFTHAETVIEADELAEIRGNLYDEMDVGMRITLWRLDLAKECKAAGIPYHPTEAVGLWRVKARYDNYDKEWKPDTIPNTMSRKGKAAQRALRAAIKLAYDLSIPDELLERATPELDPVNPIDDSPILETLNKDVVDGEVVVVTEPMKRMTLKGEDALLIQYYGIATFDAMDDDQREFAFTKLKAQAENERMLAALSPEERKARAEENAEQLGMGKNKKKRLGDDDNDPLPPKRNKRNKRKKQDSVLPEPVISKPVLTSVPPEEPTEDAEFTEVGDSPEQAEMDLDDKPKKDLIADTMIQFPGLFKSRSEAERVMAAAKASAKTDLETENLWNSIVSRKVDEQADKESK